MEETIRFFMDIAGQGVAYGGCMAFIVIILDYVITSVFSMMKGR